MHVLHPDNVFLHSFSSLRQAYFYYAIVVCYAPLMQARFWEWIVPP